MVHCASIADHLVQCVSLCSSNCGDAEMKLAEVMAEFGEFDVALVRELLQDQGGDVLEVRVCLSVRPRCHASLVLVTLDLALQHPILKLFDDGLDANLHP